ncbi:hypothetical protein NC651_036619 [Populus alba x Populus x berolinensis]|nr:hypothetical protein NC651_036619 [Populus alba x Populus x berolinensis]
MDGVMFDMIKPRASLSRLMDEYIERRGMEGHSLRFFYNGKRITKRHMQPRNINGNESVVFSGAIATNHLPVLLA